MVEAARKADLVLLHNYAQVSWRMWYVSPPLLSFVGNQIKSKSNRESWTEIPRILQSSALLVVQPNSDALKNRAFGRPIFK